MKNILKSHWVATFCAAFLMQLAALAQSPTAFTYQGRLTNTNGASSGQYEMTFGLHGAASGGNAISSITNQAVNVVDGLFDVTLDFGQSQFAGAARWLEIGIRPSGSGDPFNFLSPRQAITPTPYAIHAASVDASGINGQVNVSQIPDLSGAKITTGTIDRNRLPTRDLANTFGTLPAARIDTAIARSADVWQLDGNGGTDSTDFLGTTDNKPLQFRVNNSLAMRLTTGPGTTPNFVVGWTDQFLGAGVGGAVIGGGARNTNTGNFAVIAGGDGNSASGLAAFVGSGQKCVASATASVVAGGLSNVASSVISTVGGGRNNVAAGDTSTIPGGANNSTAAGTLYAFAAGQRAKANHTGAFVWADALGEDFASTGVNQFLIRARGGVGIGTENPATDLHVAGSGWFGEDTGGFGTNAGQGVRVFFNNNSDTIKYGSIFAYDYLSNVPRPLVLQQPGGNIGIGTTTPQGALDLHTGDSEHDALFVRSSPSSVQGGLVHHQSSTYAWRETAQSTGSATGGKLAIDYVERNNPNTVQTANVLVLNANGNVTAAGAFFGSSDRNKKKNIVPAKVDDTLERVLALPIHHWTYNAEADHVRHIGPMAQDFHAAFGLGENDVTIATVDSDGVALAAIQGLNKKVEAKDKRINELEERLAQLEKLVGQLTNQ